MSPLLMHLTAVTVTSLALPWAADVAWGQQRFASLVGVVTVAGAGNPIADAEVRAVDQGILAITDERGAFELIGLQPGEHVFEVWGEGFEPTTVQIMLRDGETLTLPAEVLALQSRTTGFQERKALGRGVFVERQQIERWNATSITEILRHVPGIRIRPNSERLSGVTYDPRTFVVQMSRAVNGCAPIAFLDGAYLGSTTTFDLDGILSDDALEAIEIYRGITEVPQRFNLPGAQCGVLAFWTS